MIQIRFLVNSGTTMHPVAGVEIPERVWEQIKGDGLVQIESYQMAQAVSVQLAARVKVMADAIQLPSVLAWHEAVEIENETDRDRAVESAVQSQAAAAEQLIALRAALGLLEAADTHFASQVQVVED